MDIKKIIKTQKNTYKEGTKACSDNCRYITFSLMAVVWGFYCKGEISMYSMLCLFMGMLVFYLMIDLLQYLIPSIINRIDLSKLQKGKFNLKNELSGVFDEKMYTEAVSNQLIERANRISDVSHILFVIKIITLIITIILMILFIIKMGVNIKTIAK